MNKLYTTEEAAEYLSVKPNTIRAWLREGTLNGVKLGRVWRVRQEDLDQALNRTPAAASDGNTVAEGK